MHEIPLDVSNMEPPEPMVTILSKLVELSVGSYLKVCHRREPFPLYEKLIKAGFIYKTFQHGEHSFIIYIAHQQDELFLNQLKS